MATMSASDCFKLGRSLLDAHDEIHNYFMNNWNNLEPAYRDHLQSLAVSLYQDASDVITHGVGVVIDDMKASVVGLVSVTGKVEQALAKISQAKSVIDIATALIAFSAAIPTGNIDTIIQAGNNLIRTAGIEGDLLNG